MPVFTARRKALLCNAFLQHGLKISKGSIIVKIPLFKWWSFCLYGTALWRCYQVGTVNKLKSAYNKTLKISFLYNRSYSVTQLLLEIGLSSWNALIIDSQTVITKSWQNWQNGLKAHHNRSVGYKPTTTCNILHTSKCFTRLTHTSLTSRFLLSISCLFLSMWTVVSELNVMMMMMMMITAVISLYHTRMCVTYTGEQHRPSARMVGIDLYLQ